MALIEILPHTPFRRTELGRLTSLTGTRPSSLSLPPAFFPKLAARRSPTILWLGCSDSRVPETTVLGLQPGDVFVHRNIPNIVSPTDINSSAIIEYGVVHLKVKHIVPCGHTSCGGAAAALGDSRFVGVLDTWLTPLKKIRRENKAEIEAIVDVSARAMRLPELNVAQGIETLLSNIVVEDAINGSGAEVVKGSFRIADSWFLPGGALKSGGTLTDTEKAEGKALTSDQLVKERKQLRVEDIRHGYVRNI